MFDRCSTVFNEAKVNATMQDCKSTSLLVVQQSWLEKDSDAMVAQRAQQLHRLIRQFSYVSHPGKHIANVFNAFK
jgi:hypothetical protein